MLIPVINMLSSDWQQLICTSSFYYLIWLVLCCITLLIISKTRSIRKMLGPFATASHRTPHCHSPGVATVTRHLRSDVHNNNNNDNNDNAWQRGPLSPHRMGPINARRLWFDVSGGESANSTYHLFTVFDCSKLCLRNISVRQESNHSERHGVYISGGLS